MGQQDFAAASAALERLLIDSPDHADGLYLQAVCLRYQGRFGAAEKVLQRLLSLYPENGRGYQEQGHCYRDQGRAQPALHAYQRACQYNPALLAAHAALLDLLQTQGQVAAARAVGAHLHYLHALPKPVLAAMDLLHQGKLLRAEDVCRRFLKRHPQHIGAMRVLADIGMRLGVLDDAEFLLESAVAFAPQDRAARIDYIQVLRKRQRFAAALSQTRELLDNDPEQPQLQSLYAVVNMQMGDFEEALRYFDRVLERLPQDAATLTSKGHALKTQGHFAAAVSCYQEAYTRKADHGEAFYSLSNLKTYRFSAAEFERMHRLEQAPDMASADRVFLYFALGKGYEDLQDYAAAFRYYQAGSDLKKRQSRYDADQMHADLEAQKQVCNPALFARNRDSGCADPDPIFIVGLPRAGSTLLEQILSSHSLVDGTLELPNILSLSHRLRRAGYPEVLADLNTEQLRQFGEDFLRDTRIHRQGAPYFIDKMPNNFRHIGLIKLILPNARIIDARRNAMACCFSGYKQLFAEGQEFSYDLEDIGRYYRDYVALMEHWDEVLPGQILRVEHEAVVDDLEGQVRRMLEFCGLPFEASCLRYFETQRNIRTPSSEQVRQPIYREGMEQWRHFEPWLEPLKQALGAQYTATTAALDNRESR